MASLASLFLMTFPVAMAFAAANDLFTMKIPNKISLALVGGFVAVAVLTRMPLETFGTNLAIGFAILGVTFVLFSLNFLGGGDAKLIAAGSIWIGANDIIEYLVFVAVFGGVLSLAILGYRNWFPAQSFALPGWAQRLHVHSGPIPYGIAIAAGALAVFPMTDIFLSLLA
ncbi:prepilin peptidase [Hyphomicrobium sp.]|uniref:A24 family peptidase n=1 Tax=Hyphomicrobium sp. TaxID=82 RepID=UPI000FB3F4DB|nr:prepilin peptidase [Hyphomicrobium sp.]RUP09373.1 MAG: peptidase [Hyphomicrobium sp.]